MTTPPRPLAGKVALVAGATRGAGRAIARALAEAGAFVACVGRSTRTHAASGRAETIDQTVELIREAGGEAVAIACDCSDEGQVRDLAARVSDDRGLDILVNDIWGGEKLYEMGVPFWELSIEKGRTMFDRAVMTHVILSRHLVPVMLARPGGLIVEVTDGDNFGYRGNLFYDLVKMAVIRLAFGMSRELRNEPLTALAVTPGFLRSEEMLDTFGVTEDNWRDACEKVPSFAGSETPAFVGRAIAALAADPRVNEKAGRVWSSWGLAKEYGFTDVDGSRPDWASFYEGMFHKPWPTAGEAAYAPWMNGPGEDWGAGA